MSQLSRGWQLHQNKRLAEAEQVYRNVLADTPHDANAWCYLGIALNDQKNYVEAVDAYRRALEISPDFPIALNNLGNSLRYLGQIDEADQCFQRAIDLKPNYFNAYKNRGTLHAWAGNFDLALEFFAQALQRKPDDAELHRNLGVIYLLLGRFPEGWNEYGWRWRVGDLTRLPNIPLWDGSDLTDKAIVLTAEQGLGDTLQFVRFARLLRDQGARTMIYCQPQLLALLQQSSALGPVYPNNLPLPQTFDFQCSLLDVAEKFVIDVKSIPNMDGYVEPANHFCEFWKDRIPNPSGAFRIGIAWQGNPDHPADHFRSIPLSHFEPLSRIPGVELLSLQRDHGSEQLGKWQGNPILRLDASVDTSSGAFMDTAAIMQTLDLVIACDSAIAHLAAAIGTPTWIGLSFVPDWRWLLDRDDSPWYPQVRLFRQPTMGDWNAVFQSMTNKLTVLRA